MSRRPDWAVPFHGPRSGHWVQRDGVNWPLVLPYKWDRSIPDIQEWLIMLGCCCDWCKSICVERPDSAMAATGIRWTAYEDCRR